MNTSRSSGLLASELAAVSLGVSGLDMGQQRYGASVLQLDWQPPGNGDPGLAWDLARATHDRSADDKSLGSAIDRANAEAVARVLRAEPTWVDVALAAREIWPAMGRTLLHAGPPISWAEMCGPMRGAVIGAILYENWAATAAEAKELASSGGIRFAPCHEWGAVGPMCGIISPSMPLVVVADRAHDTRAFAPFMEAGGARTLRFGAFGDDVSSGLKWIERVLAPTLKTAVTAMDGGLALKPIIAQALHMSDDVHNRNTAATLMLLRYVAESLLRPGMQKDAVADTLGTLRSDDMFFLSFSMAACKATMDAAHGVPFSSMVTAMARNGVNVGIRVSGLANEWFSGPADVPVGLYLPGFSEEQANPDIGDSAITETSGLGAFAMAAAPAMVQFVGGTPQDALRYSREMARITITRNPGFTLPALDFVGSPVGIDIRKVIDESMRPVINTAIAHKEPGMGIIGAGLVQAPMQCFTKALQALVAKHAAFE